MLPLVRAVVKISCVCEFPIADGERFFVFENVQNVWHRVFRRRFFGFLERPGKAARTSRDPRKVFGGVWDGLPPRAFLPLKKK